SHVYCVPQLAMVWVKSDCLWAVDGRGMLSPTIWDVSDATDVRPEGDRVELAVFVASGYVGIVGRVVASMAVGGGFEDGRHKDHQKEEGSTDSDSGRRYITLQ
ncbi:hypothetical protein Dimus_013184, partial [Dionaea muscipula]